MIKRNKSSDLAKLFLGVLKIGHTLLNQSPFVVFKCSN